MKFSSVNFDFFAYGFFDSKISFGKKTITNNRTVECYELEYFTDTGGTAFLNGKEYMITKGLLLFACPETIRHSILHFKSYYFHFTVNNQQIKEFLDGMCGVMDLKENASEIESMFCNMFALMNSAAKKNAILAEYKMLELLYRIFNLQEGGIQIEERFANCSEMVKKSIEFIDLNFMKDIKLCNIASSVHLTPIYFHEKFVKETNLTPHNYLMGKRIAYSKQLLVSSDMGIADIAAECGFSSQAYFTSIFKRYTKMTPMQYRKNNYLNYRA